MSLSLPTGIFADDSKPATTATDEGTKPPPDFVEAVKKLEKGDVKSAFELLKKVSDERKDFANARVLLANLFFGGGNPSVGRQHLELGVVEYPSDPEPRLLLAEIAVRERRFADAELQYLKAGELLTSFKRDEKRKLDLQAQQLSGLASVAEGREQWEFARQSLSELLKVKPKLAQQRLARAYLALGKSDEAQEQAAAALAADPSLPAVPIIMAKLEAQLGHAEKAKIWLQKGIAEAPQEIERHLAMAAWGLDNAKLDEAEAAAKAAQEINDKSPDAKIALGAVARFRGRPADAEPYFEAALGIVPDNFMAANQLILSLADQDNPDKLNRALELAVRNYRNNPRMSAAAVTLAWCLFKSGRLDEAEKYLQLAVSAGSTGRDTAYYTAKMLAERGKSIEAERVLRTAIELSGPFTYLAEAKQWQEQIQQQAVP